MWVILWPLALNFIHPAVHQLIHVHPRAVHDIVRDTLLPDVVSSITYIGILVTCTSRLVVSDDLREDTDAFESSLFLLTHVVETKVDGARVDVHRKPFDHLASSVERESVGVCAGRASSPVHHTSGVVVGSHIGDTAVVCAVEEGSNVGVVLHEEAAVVARDGLRGTVA